MKNLAHAGACAALAQPWPSSLSRIAGAFVLAVGLFVAAPAMAETAAAADSGPALASAGGNAGPVLTGAAAAFDTRLTEFPDIPSAEIDSVFEGDYVIVALGAGYLPDYDGSDDYGTQFGGVVRGSVGGIGFATRGLGIELDLIPNLPGNIELSFGPDVRYRTTRSGSVDDEVVNLLPRLDKTVEAGFGAGISFKKLLTPADSLSFNTGTRWDVSGNGAGRTTSLSVSYFTALSTGMGGGVSVGTTWVDGDHADYYYGITPEGSAATGGLLPAYDARGGRKDTNAKLYYGFDLDGDFRNGGFGIGAALTYERLRGSAAETPLTAMRGDRNQYGGFVAVGYAF
ncbi:MipA/OmpV family protein [Croceicoccus sp. BE223]|uniref:MipA/OmpV family protein n=1 Tax=Croceicoccus sp. BE223 TaxID=2817716 RepID=UPI00285DA27F|nr:MipA/OmpV family protein [Croceicoccus sp. BE223]MDR7101386.1 outer membrane scaffolding protein for murein synthesis (MipA/OmpV family) [Croceicoccus sp. BE223]